MTTTAPTVTPRLTDAELAEFRERVSTLAKECRSIYKMGTIFDRPEVPVTMGYFNALAEVFSGMEGLANEVAETRAVLSDHAEAFREIHECTDTFYGTAMLKPYFAAYSGPISIIRRVSGAYRDPDDND